MTSKNEDIKEIYRDMNDPNEIVKHLFHALKDEQRQVQPRIPEHVFVNLFLPFFAGLDTADPRVSLGTWVNYIGGYTLEAVVVDNKGEELFTVPAMATARTLNPMSHEAGRKLYHTINLAAMRKNTQAVKSDQLLKGIKDRFDFVSEEQDQIRQENQERWIGIYKRYGLWEKDSGETQEQQKDEGFDIFEF